MNVPLAFDLHQLHLTFEEGLLLIRVLVPSLIVWVHEVEILPENVSKLVDPLVHLQESRVNWLTRFLPLNQVIA